MQKKGGNVSLNTYADIFSTEQSRAEDRLEKVREKMCIRDRLTIK